MQTLPRQKDLQDKRYSMFKLVPNLQIHHSIYPTAFPASEVHPNEANVDAHSVEEGLQRSRLVLDEGGWTRWQAGARRRAALSRPAPVTKERGRRARRRARREGRGRREGARSPRGKGARHGGRGSLDRNRDRDVPRRDRVRRRRSGIQNNWSSRVNMKPMIEPPDLKLDP